MKKNVFDKLRRKLLKIIYQIIHRNEIYKPVGIYLLTNEYIAVNPYKQARCIDIYPKLDSTLLLPEALYESCSVYIKPVLAVETNYIVAVIPKGRIHTDNESSVAILSHDNKLIGDISFNYKNGKVVSPEENTIFKQSFFSIPKKVQGTVFTLLTGGAGLNNYFHWLVDSLPRVHLLRKSGYFEQVDWFLIPSYHFTYQKETLQLLGITRDKIIEGDKHPHIHAEIIIASTAPRGNFTIIPQWICDFLRSSFATIPKKTQQKNRYIYISRKDSAIRHITNEDALCVLLKKYDFHRVTLTGLTFQEQVNLFASAEIIVAPHGAGLINLAFCNKETKVLEIFASGYVKATYSDIAQKMGLNYYYIICDSKTVKTARQGMKLDIFVELDKIKNILDDLLPASQNAQLIKEDL